MIEMFEVITVFSGVIILLTECVIRSHGSEIGDYCSIQSTNTGGKCVRFVECPSALQQFQVNRVFPQTCGFEGTAPLVCCPDSAGPTTTTPPTRHPVSEPDPPPFTTTTTTIPDIEVKEPIVRKTGDISKQKCREYAEYVNVKLVSPVLPATVEVIEKNECGFKVVELIVGGTKANEKEFPHMAVVGFEPSPGDIKWQCGGSLISEQFVLTAGHCLFSRDFGESKYVRLGLNNLNDHTHMQQLNIKDRIRHPQYTPRSHYNDIALLKLDTTAKMTPYVRPACLYTKFDIPHAKAIASGWGKTAFAGDSSDNLLKVTLEFFTQTQCNTSYANQIGRKLDKGIAQELQLCAGTFSDEEKDTCQGDSGGPLQIYHVSDDIKCMYDIIGVTSFGKACGIGRDPGVYTRVSNYIQWIEDTVWATPK